VSLDNILLNVSDLEVSFPTVGGGNSIVVDRVSFAVPREKLVAVVGESGSGKTMLAKSLMGLLPAGGQVSAGQVSFEGDAVENYSNEDFQSVRGSRISMIFQEPMVSLNPVLKIGYQLCEAMKLHTDKTDVEIKARAIELLTQVRIVDPEGCMQKYPHEFSGGMRQRIMIASSLMTGPSLLIADEPTTALDCLVQKEVLDILSSITRTEKTSVLLITHDLGVVAHYADHVLVMEKGAIVEQGNVSDVLANPRHPYTKKLLSSLPSSHIALPRTEVAEDAIVEVKQLSVDYPVRKKWFWEKQTSVRVLDAISLTMQRGETLGVVGESGSGKTTLGRAILQLVKAAEGSITVDGISVTASDAPGHREMSQKIQLIFQDPFSALSPRKTVGAIVMEPLLLDKSLTKIERHEKTTAMLEDVGLGIGFAERYPNELSGGQRQRVSIARALISEPALVIADEPVSALDVTIQAQVLELLDKLKQKRGFSCLFISHDLAVVGQVADSVAVLYRGKVVEKGSVSDVYANPHHAYTQALFAALPELKATGEGSYGLHQREYDARKIMTSDTQSLTRIDNLVDVGNGHMVAIGERY